MSTELKGFELIRIPGDGNCLFNALIHQLCFLDGVSRWESHQDLRIEVVKFIRENLDRFSFQLQDSIFDALNIKVDNNNANSLVQVFLDKLCTEGFWGGAEVIAAFCELTLLQVNVYSLGNNFPTRFFPSSSEPRNIANIYYSGNHYDSLVKDTTTTVRNTDPLESIHNVPPTNDVISEGISQNPLAPSHADSISQQFLQSNEPKQKT